MLTSRHAMETAKDPTGGFLTVKAAVRFLWIPQLLSWILKLTATQVGLLGQGIVQASLYLPRRPPDHTPNEQFLRHILVQDQPLRAPSPRLLTSQCNRSSSG